MSDAKDKLPNNWTEVRELFRRVDERLEHPGANVEHTFWNAHRALELVIKILESSPYNSPPSRGDADKLLDETAFLRAVLATALDEIAAHGRADDAAESGR